MKLAGFLVLLAVVFLAAYAAGARFGPVTTTRSHVQYTGATSGPAGNPGGESTSGTNMSGMNMSGSP
ncbi:MAG TPA: hypothetical protein VGM12_03325 [Trebonia sp.]|jgi:hypothetical protein